MANLTRKQQKVFAESAVNNGQFGSLQLGTKILTSDTDIIQALAAYDNGWDDATLSSEELPAIEEMQGLQFLFSRQIAYLLNKGIPEWEVNTEYFIGDIQREVGGTNLYRSITDNNIGNVVTDVVNWELIGDLADLSEIAPAASQGEVDAGVISDKYIAPSTLLGLFASSSQATNGYVRIPVNIGGAFEETIIQHGIATTNSSGATINFPITFPNNSFMIVLGNNFSTNVTFSATSLGLSSFIATSDSASMGNVSWVVMGN